MTPFGIILVIAVFSVQVMQTITQPKKYPCASFRPSPQPESEPISSFFLRLPPSSVTKSQSNAPTKYPISVSKSQISVNKSPSSVSNSQVSVNKSPSSVSKSPYSIPKSPSSVPTSPTVTKSSSTVQKVTNSSRTTNRLPPDSFSLFKLPLQLISSLLVPLMPTIVRQNTSTVISPQFNLQMPLTFSNIHHTKYNPCNDTNNLPVQCNKNNLPNPCNSLSCNNNTLPNPCNSQPCSNTNTIPNPCNSQPCSNTNTTPNPCNSQPCSNTNTSPNPCTSKPCSNTNTIPNPCSSSSQPCTNTNTITTPNNSGSSNTNTLSNPCSYSSKSNYVFCNSLLGNSHKSFIYNWICTYFLNKIQNVDCSVPKIEIITTTPSEPNSPITDNPTITTTTSDTTITPISYPPTTDIPNDNTTLDDNTTPFDNTTPNDDIPTSTQQYPIPPCTPTTKFHKHCLPLIHIPKPKPKPCSLPVTKSHLHIPLRCPPHHVPCSPSYMYFNSLLNPTTDKPNLDLTSNSEKEILLNILERLIFNSNLQSPPSKSK